ncbi:unnamed protein product [Notodromas monacha]|uniref:Solute carrier family 30 member 2 n=1 Tax=Notodromas monacha TaxID=399045 RepID=A0A7R9BMT0_9CRUS|nr:unnamed protein product [Notodromas monacha]CAG0917010.1 unnamed protein product [Notodromas monacha]
MSYPSGRRLSVGTGTSPLDSYSSVRIPLLSGAASMDGGRTPPPNYRSLEDSQDPRIVYCVHGNLYSVCCIDETTGEVARIPSRSSEIVEGDVDLHASIGEPDHCHQERDVGPDASARRKLIIASVLCLLFMVGEAVGGVLANSLAIATDAAHLLTDFASFMISLLALWIAGKPATRSMSFGWYRAEVIGALTSVLMIWVVTGILVYMAFERVMQDNFDIDAQVMLITSGVGVAVNIFMALTLHEHGHGHSHSHSHSHDDPKANSEPQGVENGSCEVSVREQPSGHSHHSHQNINVRAAFIHVIGDFIQSVGVFIAALVIYFKPEWRLVDPVCTFLFSILVLLTTFAIMRDTLTVLMEGIPRGIDFAAVEKSFLGIDGVVYVHNLRIWALSMDKSAISAHLAIQPGRDPLKVLALASRRLRKEYAFFEMTLQIEHYDAKMEDCSQCQVPKK